MSDCQVCGNDTFTDEDICDDCQDNMPKPKIEKIIKETNHQDVPEMIHLCSECGKQTMIRFGDLWFCDAHYKIAKSESGLPLIGEPTISKPIPKTGEYGPEQFNNWSIEQIYKAIFNDYVPRLSELTDEQIISRIELHQKAQQIDKILEAIVIQENGKRTRKRDKNQQESRSNLIEGKIPATKLFKSEKQISDEKRDTKKKEKRMSATETAYHRIVEAGIAAGLDKEIAKAQARKILGIRG